MRYIRYLCIAAFAIAIISIAMANRGTVTVKVIPDEVAAYFSANPSVDLPLFLVILGGIVVGLLIGFVWEWMREYGIRKDVKSKGKEVRRLQRENRKLRSEKEENKGDEVLAILDEAEVR
jgi:uncharacterized integral membrane protein